MQSLNLSCSRTLTYNGASLECTSVLRADFLCLRDLVDGHKGALKPWGNRGLEWAAFAGADKSVSVMH